MASLLLALVIALAPIPDQFGDPRALFYSALALESGYRRAARADHCLGVAGGVPGWPTKH